MIVFKNIFAVLLVIYVVVTMTYFVQKLLPLVEEYSVKEEVVDSKEEIKKVSICPSFSLGHIAGHQFRVHTRFIKSARIPQIDETDIGHSIAQYSCDRAGEKALIYFNSIPIAVATVESYDYSKPLGDASKEKPTIYTVLKIENQLNVFPDSGYIVAVFDFDDEKMDFYSSVDEDTNEEDDKLILESSDTIYYRIIGEDPAGTEVKYSAIKTYIDNNETKDLAVLTVWNTPGVQKGLRYLAIFNLHQMPDSSVNRYSIFPITKIRKSKFYLSQVVDIDNDGYKETIIRKNRGSKDTFIVYDYNKLVDAYIKIAVY